MNSFDFPEWMIFWIVAVRFAVVVVAAVAAVWAISDILYWLRHRDQATTRLNLSYHFAVICAALAIELSAPFNYTLFEHMFDFDVPPMTQALFMFSSMLFVFGFFVLAQITRLIYRGVRGKLLWLAAGLHCGAIVALVAVGAYFNVYLR